MTQSKRATFFIQGHVQGVGFRMAARHIATSLGIVGWIRNREDDGVEGEVAGKATAIDQFLQWCHQGPPGASVASVTTTELSPSPSAATGFSIAR